MNVEREEGPPLSTRKEERDAMVTRGQLLWWLVVTIIIILMIIRQTT